MALRTRIVLLPIMIVSAVFAPLTVQAREEKPVSMEAVMEELSTLRALVEAQQKKIDELTAAIQPARTATAELPSAAAPSVPAAPAATAATTAPEAAPIAVRFTPPSPAPAAQSGTETSPLQFKIGDATITPVAFMDLTNTYRSTNAGTSLQTNFGSIPYNNTIQGRLTENKLSAANSRIGFRVDTKYKGYSILGYYEGDFVGGIGNAAFNTQVTSNSLVFRIRLYWVDLRKKKFEFLAGQSWSMITPNRKQISPWPADLFYTLVVDVNYMNGLTWGRIPGMRFVYHATDKATMGIALENSTPYFGGSGGGGVPILPSALAAAVGPELD